MKQLLMIFLLLGAFSCNKDKVDYISLTGDCTGYYLWIDGVEYKICNEELVDDSKVGKQVDIGFEIIEDCPMSGPGCALPHPFAGYVEIDSMI